jgi:hypothetical protein
MKKLALFAVTAILFSSCEQDIQTNIPAFQAKQNDVLWKAAESSITAVNGGLIFTAYNPAETVVLKTSAATLGTYTFGTDNFSSNYASYTSTANGGISIYDTAVVEGPVYSLSGLISGGTGYVSSAAAQTSGGSGAGLRVATEVTNGVVKKVTVLARGEGYLAGDIITIVGGANNAKLKVINVQQSNGEIVIKNIEGNLYSGTFKFNAVNAAGEVITFSEGNFYKVPLK